MRSGGLFKPYHMRLFFLNPPTASYTNDYHFDRKALLGTFWVPHDLTPILFFYSPFLPFTLQLKHHWCLYFCSDTCLRPFALFHLPWTAFHKTPHSPHPSTGVQLKATLPQVCVLLPAPITLLRNSTALFLFTLYFGLTLYRFCFQHWHYCLAHRTHSVRWKQTYISAEEARR